MMGLIPLTFASTWLTGATVFLGAFIAALWLSLVIWTARDIRARTPDRRAQILAVLVVVLLNLPGLLIYLLLRPALTLDEAYQATLEEEALLAGLTERARCPGCSRAVSPDWQVCPACSTRLRKPCSKCGKPLDLTWKVCPYCTTPQT
jgi:RNA polymerase subunit RPABC4/transcription elongation factor Spt4